MTWYQDGFDEYSCGDHDHGGRVWPSGDAWEWWASNGDRVTTGRHPTAEGAMRAAEEVMVA
ncbi:MAG: hypothetical protein ABIF77_07895 [bacterium]